MEQEQIFFTGPEEGSTLSVAGSGYRITLTGEETGGKLAIIEMNIPPGSGPVPHRHPSFQETFYVLEGEVEMRTRTQTLVAKKGATVTIPLDGPVHNFKNRSDVPARLLCIVAPAGLDAFFMEVGKVLAPGDMPSAPVTDEEKHKMKETAQQYGQQLYPPDYFDLP